MKLQKKYLKLNDLLMKKCTLWTVNNVLGKSP